VAQHERLDKLLTERGLCESRSRAQALVLAGKVIVDEHRVSKPGTAISVDAEIRVKGALPFVSRGGQKLQGALEHFSKLNVRGRIAMDIGASTGGFTDCLLQAGVERVYAIDVGYGQLAWKLAKDSRVVVHDRQNIRTLEVASVPDAINLVVIDCSFISLVKVIPCVPPFLASSADLVALVKPQFEVGRDRVGKGGIVRDADARAEALAAVRGAARSLGFEDRGACDSPIQGRGGNHEFLIWLSWQDCGASKKDGVARSHGV